MSSWPFQKLLMSSSSSCCTSPSSENSIFWKVSAMLVVLHRMNPFLVFVNHTFSSADLHECSHAVSFPLFPSDPCSRKCGGLDDATEIAESCYRSYSEWSTFRGPVELALSLRSHARFLTLKDMYHYESILMSCWHLLLGYLDVKCIHSDYMSITLMFPIDYDRHCVYHSKKYPSYSSSLKACFVNIDEMRKTTPEAAFNVMWCKSSLNKSHTW